MQRKKSFLCVGLDTDINKIPPHLKDNEDAIFEFNKAIIEATSDLCVAYKPNTAFYERHGSKGWDALERTIEIIPQDCLVIADAKRGDIGNTSSYYAEAVFSGLGADAITVAPYMGEDSVSPFLEFEDKWTIVLGLTSNKGAQDFQWHGDTPLYQTVIEKCQEWGTPEQLMFVVGATRPEFFAEIRKVAPDNFLLVPGVGAQGGSLTEVAKYGMTKEIGLLVNSSRGIIYAGQGKDFAEEARKKALTLQEEMSVLLESL
ncbi:MAG: orotidine-5'-phosphate decarboxylase [Bacteroidota bacterium]